MVDNFRLIRENMEFKNDRSFYFIQILKRKKENPEMKSYSRPLESFYVFSKEMLDVYMPHIIEKCEQNRARAYVKMNCLDAQDVMLENINELSRTIRNEDWRNMASCLNSACGQCGKQDGNEKLYIVDLDGMEVESNASIQIEEFIDSLQPHKEVVDTRPFIDGRIISTKHELSKIKMRVPTKNGSHLITTGFDLQTFKQEYPDIDVHKEGITILYIPKSCDHPKIEVGHIVTCPNCGADMIKDETICLTTYPEQFRYNCPKCGLSKVSQ